ncbi:MAG: zinc ribbon domain-containing protein [Chloroflexi bacterium]|nr:MAG: zinc ribbon domain-containing protein [Chloroflexota bacterium]RLC94330.1 MAG: zinc ribbon domain-containing protein [Chloroflexota bacterium]
MPVYDFRCHQCGKVSEVFLRSPQSETVCCPSCGSERTEKLISASYMIKTESSVPGGTTCCGRTERCEKPPCSTEGTCQRG